MALETEWSIAKAHRVLAREHTAHSKHPFPTTQDSTHGYHQMVNTDIRFIIFFPAKDEEFLFSQEKTRPGAMAQIMNSLLPNLELNWRK